MGMFSFFGENEHRVFNYKPIYYDEEEQKRREFFGDDPKPKKSGADGDSKDSYVPGSYIRGSMSNGAYRRTRSHLSKAQTLIGIITLVLIFAVLFFIAKFYSML